MRMQEYMYILTLFMKSSFSSYCVNKKSLFYFYVPPLSETMSLPIANVFYILYAKNSILYYRELLKNKSGVYCFTYTLDNKK